MKKLSLCLLFLIICAAAFADAILAVSDNITVNIRFDESTPDLWIRANDGKNEASYKIEATGLASNVDSVYTDVIDGRNILMLEFNLGNPGGRQSVEARNLYIFEIMDECKIKLLSEKELVRKHYSPSENDYIKFQNYFYSYNSDKKEITIYDSHYYEIAEIEKIQLKNLETPDYLYPWKEGTLIKK